ncbi:MAG: bifunctional metallophosphatase/5'-nucleotidase [Armatimonadota bacterium]
MRFAESLRTLPAAGLALLATAGSVAAVHGAVSTEPREQPRDRTVTVLHMSDTHAALDVHPEVFFDAKDQPTLRRAGGFALLAAAVQAERQARPGRTMLVNVGDTIHGSAVAEWTQGKAIVPIVNRLGIDVFVPGNWEYAYGPETFRKRMAELNHPVAAINLHDAQTGQRLYAPSVVKEIDGVRIGVVGITSVIVDKSMAPDYSRGLKFTFKEGVQAEVDRLRREGVEVVLLATELGLAQETRLAREIRNVDFILGGHTHERTERPITDGGIPVVQSGSEGSFLTRLTFRVRDGKVAGYEHQLLEVTPERYRPDPEVQRLVEAAQAPFAGKLKQVVGHTETHLYRKGVLESSMDNLIADAVREATGADIGMTNGFRFSYPVPAGPITEEDLLNIFPMHAPVKVGTMTGRQLREFWEESLEQVFASDAYGQRGGWGPRPSGMEVRVRIGAPQGQRVVWMKVNGRPVREDDRFTVATCDRPGDPKEMLCRYHGAAETQVLEMGIHDAMRQYLRRHRTISPRVEGRISAEDASGTVFSQYELQKAAKP